MPSELERIAALESLLKTMKPRVDLAYGVASALQGRQANATLALPHNDSWLFEDNVDATHPANLRYIIAGNTQRIVSARLSIHLAPYRTYNTLSVSSTGTESAGHTHASATHNHNHNHGMAIAGGVAGQALTINVGGPMIDSAGGPFTDSITMNNDATNTTPGATGGESATHTHNVSASGVLGVTEGATATGVTIAFDGVDHTAKLGGPFNTDQVELNVAPFLATSPGIWHTIAMQPSGLGRIEAHLRLGVYVSAAQPI